MAFLSLRRGERLGLLWEHVDLEQGVISVKQSVRAGIDADTKSRQSRRRLTMPKIVQDALRAHYKARTIETPYVFHAPNAHRWEPTMFDERYFKPLLASAGVPPIRIHDMRHTSATLLFIIGVHPKIVQEILGHSTISVTMDLYSHITPTMQAEAMKLLSDYIENPNSREK